MKRCLLSVALMVVSTAGWAQSAPPSSNPPSDAPIVETPVVAPTAPTPIVPHQIMSDFGDKTANTAWANAQKALEERRWLKPAGNNAVEYYLAARAAVMAQPKAQQAFIDATADAVRSLFPYTLMAAEAAVERNDTVETTRLIALLEQMDPQAPAVQRLRLQSSAAAPQQVN